MSELPKRDYPVSTVSSPGSDHGGPEGEHSSPSNSDSPLAQPATIYEPVPRVTLPLAVPRLEHNMPLPVMGMPAMSMQMPVMAMLIQQQLAMAFMQQRFQLAQASTQLVAPISRNTKL